MSKVKSTKIRNTLGDNILNVVVGIMLAILCVIIIYPIVYVISCSFSSSKALESGLVVLWPVDFTLKAYEFVLQYKQVWIGFRNSIFYCITCTAIFMTCDLLVAYPISRRYFKGRTIYTMLFFITTRISAGMIPNFILRCNLGLFNSIWAILLNSCVGVSSVLILRTAINSNIPEDLFDAARIDGASHFQSLVTLVIPLAKATISVLVLYAVVDQWNEYFTSMLYLRDTNLYPLQLVLRPIMTAASARGQLQNAPSYQAQADNGLENVRYALIIICTAPICVVYMFCQRYFKAGVMMGSVKG